MLSAGTLRHSIRIERNAQVQDQESGAMRDDWQLVASVRASIEPVSAREFIASQATQAAVTTRIVIRYRPGIKSSMRVLHGATVYDIQGVLPDKKTGREYLTLVCSEEAGGG